SAWAKARLPIRRRAVRVRFIFTLRGIRVFCPSLSVKTCGHAKSLAFLKAIVPGAAVEGAT
ncbi:MAG: hypothetical protein ACK4HT_05835, partial [Thermus caldifontis]